MPEIVFFAVKVGFLALLWLLVIFAVFAVRADIFGARPGKAAMPKPTKTPRPRRERGSRRPAVLVVTEGALTGTRISLGAGPISIGRAEDSTLVLGDDYVSTRHARFTPRGDQWLVEDLGSTNGTYLDRTKVTGPTLVPLGTPVRIGKTTVELRR
ncbi:MAG TPA: FHA domain-containing protein [Mycobacteriales bacterium]|nr:FHA domain-containing protein [Mycobacteriales bacterium]